MIANRACSGNTNISKTQKRLPQLIVTASFLASAFTWIPTPADAKWGYIGKDGVIKIKPTFNRAYTFDSGHARINPTATSGTYTEDVFIDKSGKVLPIDLSNYELTLADGLIKFASGGKIGYKKPDGSFKSRRNLPMA